jgi:hypothetical protein
MGQSTAEQQRSKAATKVTRTIRFGCAAGCEATALPRRYRASAFGLRPWFGLCPLKTFAGNKFDQEMYTTVARTF